MWLKSKVYDFTAQDVGNPIEEGSTISTSSSMEYSNIIHRYKFSFGQQKCTCAFGSEQEENLSM